MKFSELAWKISYPIYLDIRNHPFNLGLMDGTLPFSKFTYYLEQDIVYTPAEAKLEAVIANKIVEQYQDDFQRYILDAIAYEVEVKRFISSNPNVTITGNVAPATIDYINHYKATIIKDAAIEVAAVLPCFWFYQELGDYMADNSVENNPYAMWIDSYSDEKFSASVTNIIAIADDLFENATMVVQQQMLNVFNQSAGCEWHFFDDAYAMRVFDTIDTQLS